MSAAVNRNSRVQLMFPPFTVGERSAFCQIDGTAFAHDQSILTIYSAIRNQNHSLVTVDRPWYSASR